MRMFFMLYRRYFIIKITTIQQGLMRKIIHGSIFLFGFTGTIMPCQSPYNILCLELGEQSGNAVATNTYVYSPGSSMTGYTENIIAHENRVAAIQAMEKQLSMLFSEDTFNNTIIDVCKSKDFKKCRNKKRAQCAWNRLGHPQNISVGILESIITRYRQQKKESKNTPPAPQIPPIIQPIVLNNLSPIIDKAQKGVEGVVATGHDGERIPVMPNLPTFTHACYNVFATLNAIITQAAATAAQMDLQEGEAKREAAKIACQAVNRILTSAAWEVGATTASYLAEGQAEREAVRIVTKLVTEAARELVTNEIPSAMNLGKAIAVDILALIQEKAKNIFFVENKLHVQAYSIDSARGYANLILLLTDCFEKTNIIISALLKQNGGIEALYSTFQQKNEKTWAFLERLKKLPDTIIIRAAIKANLSYVIDSIIFQTAASLTALMIPELTISALINKILLIADTILAEKGYLEDLNKNTSAVNARGSGAVGANCVQTQWADSFRSQAQSSNGQVCYAAYTVQHSQGVFDPWAQKHQTILPITFDEDMRQHGIAVDNPDCEAKFHACLQAEEKSLQEELNQAIQKQNLQNRIKWMSNRIIARKIAKEREQAQERADQEREQAKQKEQTAQEECTLYQVAQTRKAYQEQAEEQERARQQAAQAQWVQEDRKRMYGWAQHLEQEREQEADRLQKEQESEFLRRTQEEAAKSQVRAAYARKKALERARYTPYELYFGKHNPLK